MQYVVKRGNETAVTLVPHVHKDGKYVVSLTRFKKDYIRLNSIAEVQEYLDLGYKVRMSCRDSKNHKAPSLISADAIIIDE